MDSSTSPPSTLAALLTAEEKSLWQSLISVALSLPVVLDRDLQRNAGMSHFEFSILARLSEAPSTRLRLGALARRTGSTLPRVSKAITRCEREGWVARESDPRDSRATLAVLTDGGRRKLNDSIPAHIAHVRRLILDPLTPAARKSLVTSLARLAATVGDELDRAP